MYFKCNLFSALSSISKQNKIVNNESQFTLSALQRVEQLDDTFERYGRREEDVIPRNAADNVREDRFLPLGSKLPINRPHKYAEWRRRKNEKIKKKT